MLQDISQFSYRYSMYKVSCEYYSTGHSKSIVNCIRCVKVGPVLSISHGMGVPSVGILLHEVIKLMYHAKCKDPIFIRIGTCGGVGVEGGTVCITEEAVDGLLRNTYELVCIW